MPESGTTALASAAAGRVDRYETIGKINAALSTVSDMRAANERRRTAPTRLRPIRPGLACRADLLTGASHRSRPPPMDLPPRVRPLPREANVHQARLAYPGPSGAATASPLSDREDTDRCHLSTRPTS